MSQVLGNTDPKKNLWGQVHKNIATHLDTLQPGQKALILIPRGHLKSTLVTQGWATQQLIKNPQLRILIASAKKDHAQGFAGTIIRHVESNPRFIERFGNLKDKSKWTKEQFNIIGHSHGDKEASVTTASVGTDMTSQHYDLMILDDLINREFATTEEQRQKVVDFYMDCLDLLEPDGRLVMIGTRWHFADIYSKIIEQNKKQQFFSFIFDEPMMYNPKYTRRDFALMLEDPATTYLFPEKFDKRVAKRLYDEKVSKPNGFYEFSCQQMNFPVSDANAAFRFEDIKFIDESQVPGSAVFYQTIDPAGSEALSANQDDTAIVTTGIDVNLDLYCMDCWADRTTVAGLFNAAYTQATKYPQVRKIGIERNFNATNALYLKEKYPELFMKLVSYRASNQTDKESRILALQPYVSNGKFYMVQHKDGIEYSIGDKVVKLHPGQYKLLMQMIDFGSTEHDDAIDAQAATLEFIRKPKTIRSDNGYTWTPVDSVTGY